MKSETVLSKPELEKIIGEPISDFSTSSGANKGDNVAGTLLAIQVKTVSGKTWNVVYKGFPKGDAQQMMYIVKFGIFRTETCMYEKIFPRLEQLLNERKQSTMKNKDLPIVKYISGFNDDMNDYVCLEDMRPQGFKMQDKYSSLTVPEVTLVMKELAKFHALTYFLIQYDGDRLFEEDERLRKIKYNLLTIEDPMMKVMGTKMFYAYLENAIELLEEFKEKELADKVQEFLEKHNGNTLRSLMRFNNKRTDTECFPCIVHGDCWTNNILFKYGKDGDRDTPTQLKFIDFQLSRRGNIFEDLGYFFWTSTTPEFRKLNLDNMLHVYYNAFEETISQLDYPKPIGFTRGFLLDAFYKGVLTAYLYMPFALSLQMGDLTYLGESSLENGCESEKKEVHKDADNAEANGANAPPAFDVDKMVKTDKKLMKLRMMNSPRAIDRLKDLTREIVDMKLLP